MAAAAAAAPDRAAPFRAPVYLAFDGGREPAALAVGDWNEDGMPDLVVASFPADDATVFLNDGRGALRAAGHVPSGHDPVEIRAADLDRDGHLDLAIANHDTSYVTILTGDGRGGFRPAVGSPLTVHSKPHPHTIDACDADGNGWLDLIIDDWQENRLTLLLSDGKGGFRGPGTPIEVGRRPYRNLRARDFDGDGRCDLVAASYGAGVVTVLLGDGRGGFRAQPPIPAGPAPFSVQVADLNRDGRLDLAVENYSGQITDPSDDALTFLLGDGRGGFRLGPRIETGRAPSDVAVADVDGDGSADAVTADFGGSGLTVAFGGPDGLSPSRTARVSVGRRPNRVLLVDLDGDGRADAVTANSEDHDVALLLTK
jgi:FG-GAP-like repeat